MLIHCSDEVRGTRCYLIIHCSNEIRVPGVILITLLYTDPQFYEPVRHGNVFNEAYGPHG